MPNIQDIVKEWTKNNYPQYRLTEYGLNYINNLKTPEAWLRFAKYYPPTYIRKRLLIPGYEINSKNHWKNFVFCIKNNLTSHKRIDNHPKYWGFKVQLANLDAQDRYYDTMSLWGF